MPQTDPLALAAASEVAPGMVVGLGTGRAASRAVRALGQRASRESLRITCVATSRTTERLALDVGLDIVPMADTARLDLLFDGADEADDRLRMIKGRGGAMTRERIVARAAARRLYLVQRQKMSARLGAAAPLPIEVLPFARSSAMNALRALGLESKIRCDDAGRPVQTDNGNLVFDAPVPQNADPAALAQALDATAGVVDHGFFLVEADELLIEEGDFGPVTRLSRQ